MLHSECSVTTGYATSKTWNIKVTTTTQETLASIIDDYLFNYDNEESSTSNPTSATLSTTPSPNNLEEKPSIVHALAQAPKPIPEYIRELFRHYCLSQRNPDVDDMAEIYDEMIPELQRHFFHEEEMNHGYKIDRAKIKLLFPNSSIDRQLTLSKAGSLGRQSTGSKLIKSISFSINLKTPTIEQKTLNY